jgi:proline iminopeptidase
MLFWLGLPGPASAEAVNHARGVTGHWARTADGLSIWYETEGEGVPIVLISGGPGASHNPLHLTHHPLAHYGKLVYVDNRGRGKSDRAKGPRGYTIENDVLDLEAVRRSLGAERWIVYGRSYGGMVAQAYAIAHPERVLGLIVSNSLDGASSWEKYNIENVKRYLADQFPEQWDRIASLHEQGYVTSQDTLAAQFRNLGELYSASLENDSLFRAQSTVFRDPEVLGHNRQVYEAMVGPDPDWAVEGTLAGVELAPGLVGVHCPALVLAGRYDRITPPAAQRIIANALPGARLVMFEHSGHRPEFEESARWLRVVGGFLEEVLSAPAPTTPLDPPPAAR